MMPMKHLKPLLLMSILCIAGLLGMQFWLLAYAEGTQEERVVDGQVRQELLRLQRLIAEVDMAFRGYVLVKQPQFLDPMVAAERQIPEVLDRLTVLTMPWAELRGRVRILAPRVKDFLSMKRQLARRLDEGLEQEVLLYIRTGEGIALANTLAFAFKDLDRRIEERERIREADRKDRGIRIGTGLIVTTLGALGVGVGIGRVRLQSSGRVEEATTSVTVRL